MQEPALPMDESRRLAALRGLGVLDTPAEDRFDRITRIAQRHFGVQIALVSLIDAERQWFKSRQGLDACETGRDISFCGHAILAEDTFYVPNALEDARFADNPLVTGGPEIRFYAGAPLHAPDGSRIGTLCIIDPKARTLSDEDFLVLRDLADMAEGELGRTHMLAQANEARELASLLDAMIENLPVMLSMKRASDLRMVMFNKAGEQICGFTREQLIGRNDHDFFPREEADFFALKDRKVLNETGFEDIPEEIITTADGRKLTLHTYKVAIRNAQGTPQYLLGISEDITERKRSEDALRQFKHILDNTLDMIFMFDAETLRFVYLNEGAVRSMGFTHDDLLALHPYDIKPLMPEPAFRQFIAPLLQGEQEKLHFETVHRRKDGTDFPVEIFLQLVRDGRSAGRFIAIVRDISERKQAETALHDQVQHTQAILDNVIDGIITIDESGLIASANHAAEHIFGYQEEEMIGQNVKMLMPEPYHSQHDGYLHNYRSTGLARIIGIGREVVGRHKNGKTFPMDLAVSRIQHHNQRMFVGLVRDISERKRAEKMKSEFVSTVSHELRTPLTSISGSLGLLAGGALGPIPDQAKPMLDIALKNSQRLTHLINDILDMEKIAAGKMHFEMQVQPLMPLIVQALEANSAYADQHQVRYELSRTEEGVEVCVDSQRLTQILANLLSNAAKFSPAGSQVEVSVIRLNEGVRIAVADQGPGIPEEFRARIFQKFSQSDSSDTRKKGGTGLGLAISKELAERMGGSVGFESEAGQGATFYIDLPLAVGEMPPESGLPVASGAAVLVVEDDPDVAQLLALMLRRGGYQADVALSGQAALESLEKKEYAAITLDLGLPDITGLELIRSLRGRPETRNLPIIVVSGRVEEGRLAISGDFSCIDWLPKPIDEQLLLASMAGNLPKKPEGRPRILHVEDDADLRQVIQGMAGGGFDFDCAGTLAEARAQLARKRYDLVLLDIELPDGSGWELLPGLRDLEPMPRVIVLSVSELDQAEQARVEIALLKSHVSPRTLLDALNARILKSKELSK